MSKPAVSVIMACHNAEPFLREAVDSVMHQTLTDWELIVINDGSTDGSRKVLRTYEPRITVIDQPKTGPYPARNRGIEASRGEFVAFLDADDYWAPTCLERLYDAITTNSSVLSYCGWQNVGATRRGNRPHVPRDHEAEGKLEGFLRGGSPWPIHAALTRRDAIIVEGSFRTYLPTSMDYDLWVRVGVRGEIVLVPEVLAYYRHHEHGQITSDDGRQAINSWTVKRRFVDEHPQLFQGVSRNRVRAWTHGVLMKRGYDNYWRRDLAAARRIFRRLLWTGYWHGRDLPYLLPALLPVGVHARVIALADAFQARRRGT